MFLTGCSQGTTSAEPRTDISAMTVTQPASPEQAYDGSKKLSGSNSEVVRGLGQLETSAESKIFDGAMHFVGESSDDVSWHPDAFKQINKAGLSPITILEPRTDESVTSLASPGGEEKARKYFEGLKGRGVTSEMLGTVVLMPEYYAGGWKGAKDSSDFPRIVNSQAAKLRESFPNAETSILIDVAEYESSNLIPELSKISKSSIGSIGIQGFSNGQEVEFTEVNGVLLANVEQYLRPEVIENIVKSTGDGKLPIWINTGIGEAKYSTNERIAIAEGIVRLVESLQSKGIEVQTVNIFAQNKEGTEGIDFSISPEQSKKILPYFKQALAKFGVKLSGFAPAA